MIEHKFIAGQSKTGFPQQTLVIMVDSLKGESLIEASAKIESHGKLTNRGQIQLFFE